MSVEAQELTSDEWTRWQGHVVNGVFTLGRHLGCSERGGVFVTKMRSAGHGQVAIKLLPAGQAQEELQLPRWARTGDLAHPHLLPLLESGACLLDGFPYLYAVMEYADQTLAQLLQRRALTAEEAREMLPPILEALAFLHERHLIQGALQPSNVLVVGEQLKLASDTVRQMSDATLSGESLAHDPPEESGTGSSSSGDVWRLGVTLFEALTRRPLPHGAGRRSAIALPADFPSEFRDVVARCLRTKPQDRPSVKDLIDWLAGQPLRAAQDTPQPAAWERPEPATMPATSSPMTTVEDFVEMAPSTEETHNTPANAPLPAISTANALDAIAPAGPSIGVTRRITGIPLALLGVATLALLVAGISSFRAHRAPDSARTGSTELTTLIPSTDMPGTTAAPTQAAPNVTRGDTVQTATPHQEIPVVSRNAARTIRGHVNVAVNAAVAASGTVSSVELAQSDRSKYFRRISLQAAKKWTFAPLQGNTQRVMEVRFEFTRDGTTVRAVPIH